MARQFHISGKNRLLRGLVIVLFVLSLVDDYQGWRFLLLCLAGAWGLGYLWARALAQNLGLEREIRFGWAQVGDQLEERFTISNRSFLPAVWVELVDGSTMPGYQPGIVSGIEGSGSLRWQQRHLCSRRGLFSLGPTMLRASDPLGLYSVEVHDPRSLTLMVTPPIVPLPQIEVAPGGRAGEGRPRPNAPERTVSASGVRAYSPGEDLRWIHWRTSARRDDLYVRTLDSTPSGDWWIVLDLNQAAQAGQAERSTAEHGIVLAASLADRGLRLGRAVGLVGSGEPLAWLPPREGDGQRWEILRSLALIVPGERSLAGLFTRLRPSLGRDASLVIITPDVSGDWLEALLPLLWQGLTPTLLLLDPASFGGSGDARPLLDLARRWGLHCQRITPDLLDRPEAQPGRKGRWEWRVSPTGRARAANPARDSSWKVIS